MGKGNKISPSLLAFNSVPPHPRFLITSYCYNRIGGSQRGTYNVITRSAGPSAVHSKSDKSVRVIGLKHTGRWSLRDTDPQPRKLTGRCGSTTA